MTKEDLIKSIAFTGRFEGVLFGQNNETLIAWAKEYLDLGFKVELKCYYISGWRTSLKIEPCGK